MREKLDILYVGFVTGHGGDAMQLLDLAAGMVARNLRVKIVVPRQECSEVFSDLCRQRRVPLERSAMIQADVDGVRQRPADMMRFFASNRNARIVHLHTGGVCLPRQAMLAMRVMRYRRVFITVQSPYDEIKPGDARARFWSRAVSSQVHQVLCPSERSRRLQISYGVEVDRVRRIPNSVDIDRFERGDASVARTALGVSPDTPLVVFSSRLDEQKRPVDALLAFAQVASAHFDCQLVFVGRGRLEATLKRKASELGVASRIRFVGQQMNVPDWLAAATVWFLPTEMENFSLAVLEALAASCAVVSTLCPGNDEILVDGRNALATDVGDVSAQAYALDNLLKDAPLRRRLGAAARQSAEPYRVDRVVEQYARCYDEYVPILGK